jgi:hypothetical protein
MKTKKNDVSKLTLAKETLKGLTVTSGVQAGIVHMSQGIFCFSKYNCTTAC